MGPLRQAGHPRSAAVVWALLVLAACGGSPESAAPAPTPTAAPAPTSAPLQAVIVGTQLMVGAQRFPIGISQRNTPVTDAAVHVRVFGPNGGSLVLEGETDAPYRGDGLEGRGLYVAHLQFDVAGAWRADITSMRPDGSRGASSLAFGVRRVTQTPMVGQPAFPSQSLTAADVPDVSYIDSGQPPDDMHAVSIAGAVAQHRATLVVFATPAFCTSATCGPQVHAIQQLEPAYRDRLTFVHIEIYRNFKPDPAQRQLSPTVVEWHLQTEPWVFLIDHRGSIAAAFEGATATDELQQAIDQLLAAG